MTPLLTIALILAAVYIGWRLGIRHGFNAGTAYAAALFELGVQQEISEHASHIGEQN